MVGRSVHKNEYINDECDFTLPVVRVRSSRRKDVWSSERVVRFTLTVA